jgi:hypothetical protein
MMLSRTYIALLFAAAVCVSCDKVPLTAPVNSTLTVNAGTTVLPIGGSTQVQATVIEQAGTPVHDGTTVRFTTTLGRLDPPDPQTHNGVATTTFLAGDTSGLAEVRATSGGAGSTTPTTPTTPTSPTTPTTAATSSNVVMISVGTAAVETVTVRVNPATVSQNGGTVQVIATVTGTGGRLLSNLPVTFSATRGTLSAGTAITDANGEARVTLMTNADTDVTATAGTKTSTAAKVTSQPGPSVTLTCAVGSTNNCASVSTGDTATFTAARASTSSAIRTSTLDFGDGQSQSLGSLSSSVQVPHRYNTAGTFTAVLTATDINDETTTASTVITVTDLVATISLNVINTVTHTVQATATLSATGSTIARYEWQFQPDGNPPTLTTTTNSATSSFATGGTTKTVIVRVVLTDGRSAQATGQINVP